MGALKITVMKMTDQIAGHENAGHEIASVELAGLPAPPTSHTLHLYPFHPSPTFPLPKLYCWKLRNSL